MSKPGDYVPADICLERMKQLHDAFEETLALLRSMEQRLWKDNGSESIQTQLLKGRARMMAIERTQKVLIGVLLVVAGAAVTEVVLAVMRRFGLI